MQLTLRQFDYTQLDSETRIVVQQRTGEIKVLMRRTAQGIIEIGEKLIEVKSRLPHGAFGRWLESEFEWGTAQAARFMQVAERFGGGEIYQIDKFAPSALYLLAAPSTPDEVRAEAISRAEAGERITHQVAQEMAAVHRNGNGHHQSPQPLDTRAAYDAPPQEFNYKRDSRRSQPSDIYTPQGMDACQTPAYALDPLLPYLDSFPVIWEPAAGEGYLVEAFYDAGWLEGAIEQSDILTGQNFFDYEPPRWNCLVTNPPYSIQFQWLERCYQLGKPFALLLKVEALGTKGVHELIKQYGFEMLLLDKRVDFKMPFKGWDSSAQFPTFWLCWQLLPEKVVFGTLDKERTSA